jgi:hypothetical protein
MADLELVDGAFLRSELLLLLGEDGERVLEERRERPVRLVGQGDLADAEVERLGAQVLNGRVRNVGKDQGGLRCL